MKQLVVLPNKCRGCMRCELYCSIKHFKTHKPSLSMIAINHLGVFVAEPLICTQCGHCLNACNVHGAMRRDLKLGRIIITDKCTGCGACALACPYGLIIIDPRSGKAMKCDLCDGDPECVKHCPYNALAYLEVEQALTFRQVIHSSPVKTFMR